MNIRLLTVPLCAALLTGCGKTDSTPASASTPATTPASSSASATPIAAKAGAPAAGAKVFEITGNDTMKFSLATMEVAAGQDFKVVFTNVGTLPKEAMGHNWVLLKPGTDVATFATAAMTARDTDYIPAAMKDQVIAHTAILGPKKSEELSVKGLPAGEYAFICSFPGHYIQMKGTLTVK